MVIKFVESTYDSFRDKLKNPFYGTLFVVWVIRNREFIFNVFFNDDITSDERLKLIRDHFLNWESLVNFIGTIFISLGLMVLIYASLNLSRFIVEFSERKLKPWIQQLFSKTSIVSREDFQALEKERDYFQKMYSEERSEKNKLQIELDNLSKKQEDPDSISQQNDDNPDSINNRFFQTWSKDLKADFKTLIGLVNNYDYSHDINNRVGNSVFEFLSLNLIEKFIDPKTRRSHYKFTQFGEKAKTFFLNNFK